MKKLTQLAMAGTVKVASEPKTGTAVDELFVEVPGIERERTILLQAAAEASYALAGQVPGTVASLPAPAPDERLAVCSPALAQLLDEMMHGQNNQALPEALTLMTRSKLRLPPAMLPLALNLCQSAHDLRDAVRPVLGERGFWLSRLNPHWAWVEQDDESTGVPQDAETVWTEGTTPERLSILKRVRREDQALARSWVEAVWRQEKAEVRHSMLSTLRIYQSQDDEPFFEQALDDRASTVRELAAVLLSDLPESRLIARMRERADALLDYTPAAPVGGLRGLFRVAIAAPNVPGTLRVRLPEQFDKAWQRDGLDEKPPYSLGQRSWWLTQLLGQVNPAHWQERFTASPSDLIQAALASEWGLAVLDGWSLAASKYGATDWAMPLWNAWTNIGESERYYQNILNERMTSIARLLPDHERRNINMQVLKNRSYHDQNRFALLKTLPMPWDIEFANLYLDVVKQDLKSSITSHWHQTLNIAAIALSPASFERALRLFTPNDEQPVAWYVKAFVSTIQMRQRLYKELNP